MKAISELVKVPLVLHGGTGIADDDIRKAIACGTAKLTSTPRICTPGVKP